MSHSKSKTRIVTVIKLLLVAALMTWVFSSVPWKDTLVETARTGQKTEQPGKIVSDWKADPVEFRPLVAGKLGEPRSVRRSKQADGSETDLMVGFPTYLKQLDITLFLLGALTYGLTVVVSGARWWRLLLMNELKVSFWEAQRFTWIGLFFNNVVPGATGGDLVKALYIMKHCPGARVPALVSVIVDRVMGLGSLALLAAIVVLFGLERFGKLALVIWAVLLAVGAVGVIAFSRRLRELLRIKHLLNRLPARLASPLKLVDQAIFYYRSHFSAVLGWTVFGMIIHVMACTSVLLMGRALGVGLPTLDYFVLVPIANLVSAVPLGPNGWGLGELSYRSLFGLVGPYALPGVANATQIMGTRGVALSVLHRMHVTMWSLVGGIAALLEKDKVTKADLEREVELEQSELADQSGKS